MNTDTMIKWSGVALVLALWAGCATETKQTETPSGKETPPPVVNESAPKAMPEARPTSDSYALPGYAVYEVDGRLWIFRSGSEGQQQFLEHGEPAKSVGLISEGPDGKTIRALDKETAQAYLEAWKGR